MFLFIKSHGEDRTPIKPFFHERMFQAAQNNVTTKHRKVVQQNPMLSVCTKEIYLPETSVHE